MLTRIETDSIDLAAASPATADNQRKTQEALPLSWSASTDVLFPPPGVDRMTLTAARSSTTSSCMCTRTQRHPHGAVTGAIPMLTRIETYSIDLAAASQATADNQRKTQEALPLSWSASTDVLFPPSGHQLCACIQLSVNQTPAKQSSSRPAVIASNGRPASTAIVDLNTARRRHTAKLTHHRSECPVELVAQSAGTSRQHNWDSEHRQAAVTSRN